MSIISVSVCFQDEIIHWNRRTKTNAVFILYLDPRGNFFCNESTQLSSLTSIQTETIELTVDSIRFIETKFPLGEVFLFYGTSQFSVLYRPT